MSTFLNLDLSNSNKTTDYAFRINTESVIQFRVHDGHYVINYDDFLQLTLTLRYSNSGKIDVLTLNGSNVASENGEKFVRWKVPSSVLDKIDILTIDVKVRLKNKTYDLGRMKLITYEVTDTGMNGILTAIQRFNYMISLYLNSVKRTEINKSNGVVGLDGRGKIDKKYLQDDLNNHIPHRLIDTLDNLEHIHGLKLHKDNYKLLYLDEDDEEYYYAHQIHGGKLGYPNKPEYYNIFGGLLNNTITIDASTFDIQVNDVVNGGTIGDFLTDTVDAGNFIDAGVNESDIMYQDIHGGFL